MRKTVIAATIAVLSVAAVSIGFSSTAGASSPSVIDLPDGNSPNGLAPEGIVSGDGNTFYTGSLTTGQIVVGDYKSGETAYLVTNPVVAPSVGLAYDKATKLLWAAGGPSGSAAVYDSRTGSAVNIYDFGGGFVNDAIVAGDSVFFTDSFAPVLYRVAADGSDGVDVISLSGPAADFVQDFNINGIEVTADGKTLILVNTAKGELYTVNPESGESASIDLGGEFVSSGDGILLEGRTLYVMQNSLNQIAKIKLSGDLTSGQIVDTITDPAFNIPTTIASKGSKIAAVNAVDFGQSPFDDYTVVLVGKN
jgi:WD40 repeat protein